MNLSNGFSSITAFGNNSDFRIIFQIFLDDAACQRLIVYNNCLYHDVRDLQNRIGYGKHEIDTKAVRLELQRM